MSLVEMANILPVSSAFLFEIVFTLQSAAMLLLALKELQRCCFGCMENICCEQALTVLLNGLRQGDQQSTKVCTTCYQLLH